MTALSAVQSSARTFLLPTNEVWGKVIFLHLSVILFTGGSTWAGTPWQVHPQAGTHPRQVPPRQVHSLGRYTSQTGTLPMGRYTLLTGTPPWEQCMLGDMGNKQAVCILLECILVSLCFFVHEHLQQCIIQATSFSNEDAILGNNF